MKGTKIFIEYGLDFDNNKYAVGCSSEIELSDGTEFRTCEKVKMTQIKERYLRMWVGKFVFVFSTTKPHFSFARKKRWNVKLVFGVSGY